MPLCAALRQLSQHSLKSQVPLVISRNLFPPVAQSRTVTAPGRKRWGWRLSCIHAATPGGAWEFGARLSGSEPGEADFRRSRWPEGFKREGRGYRMPKMKAVQVPNAGGDLEVVERDISDAGPGQVRIRVQACGKAYSSDGPQRRSVSGISFPRVPGHEVGTIVDAVGPGVMGWSKGEA